MPGGEADSPHFPAFGSDAPRPRQEILTGTVRSVIFHSRETGFCVLSVSMPGESEPVRLVGATTGIDPGESIRAEGSWVRHAEHGRQFKASGITIAMPTSRNGMESYLASGAVEGIGPKTAKTIVAAFGEKTFDILSREPERLQALDGIGRKRAATIAASWTEKQNLREILLFLHSHGVGAARAAVIYKRYGDDTISLVSRTPYRLMEIHGIGFLTADRVALSVGIARNAPERLRAGVTHAVRTAVEREGHCAMPQEELARVAAGLLECEIQEVESAISCEIKAGGGLVLDRIGGEEFVFPRDLHNAERSIAADLRRLSEGGIPWLEINATRAIEWVESRAAINLGAEQRAALPTMFSTKLMLLTGGPGVGKTTIIHALLRILGAKKKADGKEVVIRLCAPTGRAARRLEEATGAEAATIHRLLEFHAYERRFLRNRENPLDCDLVVVDETSMVDTELMAQLLAAVPDRAALLLVGDADQLPSVGPGRVLAELIESGTIPVVHLSEVFRQIRGSRILEIAHRINRGEAVDLMRQPEPDEDFFFVSTRDQANSAEMVVRLVRDRIPAKFGLDPIREVQVLSPMQNGDAGVKSLNRRLQQELNGGAGQPSGTQRLWPGDRVMQTRNDYDRDVFNGDIGYVEARPAADGTGLRVRFGDRRVEYEMGDADALSLAYAATVHKSQGSEYPAVVIVLHRAHSIMLRRNLLYTAVTRGQQLVVLVGEAQAVRMAIHRTEGGTRHTKLQEWLDPQDCDPAGA